jgi:hypothetical protein
MSQSFKFVFAPVLGFGRSFGYGILFSRKRDGMWDRRRFGEDIRKSPSRCPLKLEDTILEKRLQYIYRPFEMLFVHIISGLAQVLEYNAAYDLAIPHTGFASTKEITIGQIHALSRSFGLRDHRASGRVGGHGGRGRRRCGHLVRVRGCSTQTQ